MERSLSVVTPTIESTPLSNFSGFNVFLKLENTQPSTTFKIRGIGLLCQKAAAAGAKQFVASSGGNAGLAAAYAGKRLGIPTLICVPQSTSEAVKDRIRQEGAVVETHGAIWNDTNEYALEISKKPGHVYIHPFDHPDIWDGHASMIVECHQQLAHKPDLVVCCCGGGGLFNGVAIGLQRVGWPDVPILVMETVGANCFNQSIKAGRIVRTAGITSIAKTLGSTIISEKTWELIQQHTVYSEVVTDEQALDACFRFSDDHNFLVEPSCGATLAALYSSTIRQLVEQGKLKNVQNVLIIVCGGNGTSITQLGAWKQQLKTV